MKQNKCLEGRMKGRENFKIRREIYRNKVIFGTEK